MNFGTKTCLIKIIYFYSVLKPPGFEVHVLYSVLTCDRNCTYLDGPLCTLQHNQNPIDFPTISTF